MDILQAANTSVLIPINVLASNAVMMVDPGNLGTNYKIIDPAGGIATGAGSIINNSPVSGITRVMPLASELVLAGQYTVVLLTAGGVVVGTQTVQGPAQTSSGGAQAIALFTGLGPYAIGITAAAAGIMAVAITSVQSANLGPYAISLTDSAGNALGGTSGNVVSSLGGGLSAAGVRAAVGLAAANLDGQLAGQPALLLDLANGIETGLTLRQAMRLLAAIDGGQVVIAPGLATFRAAGVPATTRVVASVPGDGSRPAVTLTL